MTENIQILIIFSSYERANKGLFVLIEPINFKGCLFSSAASAVVSPCSSIAARCYVKQHLNRIRAALECVCGVCLGCHTQFSACKNNVGIQSRRDRAKEQQAVFVYPASPSSKNALTLCPAALCLQPQLTKFIPAVAVFRKLVLFTLWPHPALGPSHSHFTSCVKSPCPLVSDATKTKGDHRETWSENLIEGWKKGIAIVMYVHMTSTSVFCG